MGRPQPQIWEGPSPSPPLSLCPWPQYSFLESRKKYCLNGSWFNETFICYLESGLIREFLNSFIDSRKEYCLNGNLDY